MYVRLDKPQSRQFWSRFIWKRPRNGYPGKEKKIYEIKLKQVQCPHYAQVPLKGVPKQNLDASQPSYEFPHEFAAYDMSDGIPSKTTKYDVGKSKPLKYPAKTKIKREEVAEKIEIYYFDHGSSA